jgi:hypothetical protein
MSGSLMKPQASGKWCAITSRALLCSSPALLSSGLPTRARIVSEFMLGLEKMKAKSGEVSQSARALMLDDIYRLYHHCVGRDMPEAERRRGIVRYVRVVLWP